jgi:DNA-binding MurR/RpiR family transcriptional regulator
MHRNELIVEKGIVALLTSGRKNIAFMSLEDIRLHPPFAEIWERLPRLPRQQRRLAEAILMGPALIAFSSLREVAERVNVNAATIVRFAQSFGYEGYGEFQSAVRLAYKQRAGFGPAPQDTAAALRSSDDAVSFMNAQHLRSAEVTHRNVAAADLDGISSCLEKARRIVIFAEASAQVPALLFLHFLRHAMLQGTLVNSELDAMIAMHDLGPEDVVVFLALTLTFRATVTVHDFAQRRGAKTIAITGSPLSPLQLRATHVIVAPAESPTMRFSVVAATHAVELLFAHIVSRRPEVIFAEQGALLEIYQTTKLAASLHGETDL